MNFNEFVSYVIEKMEDKMGSGYTVNSEQIIKNNGLTLEGLLIMEQGSICAPNIYLDEYFEQYESGAALDEIIEDIYTTYKNIDLDLPITPSELSNFEAVREKVLYKLIRREGNEQLLSDVPFIPFLDLAIVFYLLLNIDEDGQMATLIHNEHLIGWNVTKEELHNIAKENTEKTLPASIVTMFDMMVKIIENNVEDEIERKIFIEGMKDEMMENEPPLFVLTNSTGLNGAICILYPEVLHDFSQTQNSDVIILPSSIHETLLTPFSDDMEQEDLKAIVMRVNGDKLSLDPQDVLSDSVYIYRRDSRQIEIGF